MSSRKVRLKPPGKVRRRVPPKTDEFEILIRDLASDGRGVGEAPDGQVVFVAGVWLGELVRVRRTRQGATTDTLFLEVIEAHDHRVTPACTYHRQGQCGGCPWMFMGYEAQVSAKQVKLASALVSLSATHLGCRVNGSVRQLGYRNRAQLKTNGRELGYLGASSHDLADIETCAVLTDSNQMLLSRLRDTLPNSAWRPRSKQKWITLDIDDQRDAPIIDKRQPFRQANDGQNAVMRDWLADKLAALVPEGPVLELFCGNGNLTSVIAECNPHAQVVAVEGDEAALEALATRNIASVTTERVNLFDDRQIRALISALPSINGVVLDPPRDGLKARDAFGSVFSECSWVVYISCNLATWQRDAQFLHEQGLRLTQVEGLDMFPQTPHLEVLSVFERQWQGGET